jgi:phage-related protein
MPTTVAYYISSTGHNPVHDFLRSLSKQQRAKLHRILTLAEKYNLDLIYPYVRKLSGTQLWEIRIIGGDNIRIFYIAPAKNYILILHGFKKKQQKTPHREIMTAEKRLRDWRQRYEVHAGLIRHI